MILDCLEFHGVYLVSCHSTASQGPNIRVFELADTPKLLTLDALGKIWITLDLLFSTSQTCYGEPFSRFPSFCDAPVSIDNFAVDVGFAI